MAKIETFRQREANQRKKLFSTLFTLLILGVLAFFLGYTVITVLFFIIVLIIAAYPFIEQYQEAESYRRSFERVERGKMRIEQMQLLRSGTILPDESEVALIEMPRPQFKTTVRNIFMREGWSLEESNVMARSIVAIEYEKPIKANERAITVQTDKDTFAVGWYDEDIKAYVFSDKSIDESLQSDIQNAAGNREVVFNVGSAEIEQKKRRIKEEQKRREEMKKDFFKSRQGAYE